MIAASIVFAASDAAADDPEWKRLFDKARELSTTDWQAACALFERSFELNPSPTGGSVVNLADCEEKRGNLPKAWRLWIEAAQRFEQEDLRQALKLAREKAASVAARATTVVITVPDPDAEGLTIRLNGEALEPAAEIERVVNPGEIEVIAQRPRRTRFVQRRRGAVGETIAIGVTFAAKAERARPVAPAQPARRRSRVVLGIGIGAAGLAALAGGVAIGLVARNDYAGLIVCEPACDANERRAIDDAQQLGNIGTGFGIAGIALLVTGGIVYATAPKDVVVTPTITPGSAGISMSARF